MAEFTKAPWSAKDGIVTSTCDHMHVAVATFDDDAKLIAAAPDLYEALSALMGADNKITVAIGGNPIYVEKLMARARSALARAEGKGGT